MKINHRHLVTITLFFLCTEFCLITSCNALSDVPSLVYISAKEVVKQIATGKTKRDAINIPANVREYVDFLLPFYSYDPHLKIVRFWLGHALITAIRQNRISLVQNILLDAQKTSQSLNIFKNELKSYKNHCIIAAIERNNTGVIEFLLTHHLIDINKKIKPEYEYLIQIAACLGNLPLFQLLLHYGADIHLPPFLMCDAAAGGNINIIQLLLNKGLNIHQTTQGKTPLHCAAEYGHKHVFDFLIEKGADIHTPELLLAAAQGGNIGIARRILDEAKADINEHNEFGNTPLFYAAKKGHVAMFTFLIKHKAQTNIADLLIAATQGGNVAIAQAVLNISKDSTEPKRGTDINEQNGETPLFYAAIAGNERMFFFLWHNHANIYKKNKSNETLLHSAVRGNS